MSESESEYSQSDSYSDSYSETSESDATFSSFQEELEDMMSGLAQLDEGLYFINTKASALEHPVATVAIQSFTNPRILESAPFRETKFRLRHSMKTFLNAPHHTATFAELGEFLRTAIRERKEEVEEMWGTSDFLGILQHLPDIVE